MGRQILKVGKMFRMNYPTSLSGPKCMEIGDNFQCLCRNRIDAFGRPGEVKLRIGNHVTMENDCHIGAANYVEIGDNTMMASRVYIADHSHGEITAEALSIRVSKRPIVSKGPVIIGKNVWIGEGVAILPGVTIGDNAIIGANAVVTHDVPANCVAAGNPARIIKKLVQNQ